MKGLMLVLKVTTIGFILLKKLFLNGLCDLPRSSIKGYYLIPANSSFERQMHLAEKIMSEDRELLHQLAK